MSFSINKHINVLFIIIQPKMGGAERLVYNLIHGFDRRIFNPSLAYFNEGCDLNEFQNLDIPIYHIPKTKRFDFSTMRQIARIIEKQKIDIVNAHHFMPMIYSFYGTKMLNKVRLVYTEHSKWELENINFYWKFIARILLSNVDLSIGVSKNIANTISDKFKLNAAKTSAIYNGVSVSKSTENKRESLKKELNIKEGCKIVGIVANFRKIKNHIFLLKAFNEVLKVCQNVKLLLIGQGFEGDQMNSESEIRKYIIEQKLSKNVLFLGYRSDVLDLLNVFDIFCLTSFKEGLPISLIEAMSAGIPVIGTNVEGINEVIIHKKNGFLVQLDDVKELKDNLLKLLKNKDMRIIFGLESKKLIKKKYTLEGCINKYQNIFQSIMYT